MWFANTHNHLIFSDGKLTPRQLVRKFMGRIGLQEIVAAAKELRFQFSSLESARYQLASFRRFANRKNLFGTTLNDHDTLSGIEPMFRALIEAGYFRSGRQFIPGIELSTNRDNVHILGYFTDMDEHNFQDQLAAIDEVLGGYCRFRCEQSEEIGLLQRVQICIDNNLDHLKERYKTAQVVMDIIRPKGVSDLEAIWQECGKPDDVIQHPMPLNYPILANYWTELLPDSSYRRITLYIIKPTEKNQKELARIYQREDGMKESEAMEKAIAYQGILSKLKMPDNYISASEGLALLKRAGKKVKIKTVVAHGANQYRKTQDFKHFDVPVLMPLIDEGLDGIECYYPYDQTYRSKAIDHYLKFAGDHSLLVTGGTDFHGDGRTMLDDIMLPMFLFYRLKHAA